jgi:hypothetical protein
MRCPLPNPSGEKSTPTTCHFREASHTALHPLPHVGSSAGPAVRFRTSSTRNQLRVAGHTS